MKKRIKRIRRDLDSVTRQRILADEIHSHTHYDLDAQEDHLRQELAEAEKHHQGLQTLSELLRG